MYIPKNIKMDYTNDLKINNFDKITTITNMALIKF